MNRTSKLLNSLALVAALTVSTAVYAMESEDPKVTVTKQSPVVVNEDLMEEARRIAREKVLENLYDYSDYYFSGNSEMKCYDPLDVSKKFSMNLNKVQYDRNIHYFDETFLSHPSCMPTFNRDILAFLEHGTTPIYCNYEGALFGVAQALNKAGITLEALVGKIDAVEEALKQESTPS